MRWRIKIIQVAGIDIFIHVTFLLLVGWFAFATYFETQDPMRVLQTVLILVTLFGIIVLHELGHALTARRYGIRTQDIVLYPIGGVARLDRMPDDPKQELLVALAGPAVNVVIAVLLFAILYPLRGLERMQELDLESSVLLWLMWINVILVVFNMLPAFPMDGGRVFRALLAMIMPYTQATSIAAAVGQAMAILFVFLGLYINPFLILIAIVVWMGAADESASVRMRGALTGVPISHAMITHFETIEADDTLGKAVDLIIAGFQQDFPVLDRGELVGVLTRNDLFKALGKEGREGIVRDVMSTDFRTADPRESLDRVLMRLEECNCYSMPVLENGEVVGIVTMDNLGEFLTVRSALKRAGA